MESHLKEINNIVLQIDQTKSERATLIYQMKIVSHRTLTANKNQVFCFIKRLVVRHQIDLKSLTKTANLKVLVIFSI